MDHERQHQIAANVQSVQQRIVQSAIKSGRTYKDVRLIAVTKYAEIGDGMIEALVAAGCSDLGEARPQRLFEKAEYSAAMPDHAPIRWHLIGVLQRNKVRKILPVAALIHSLDSRRLAETIDRIADEEQLPPIHCLLEVALSKDTDKHGIPPEQVLKTLDEMGTYRNIVVDGLMGMAGLESDELQIRREFELLRKTAESARERNLPSNVPLMELSMGMSDDFEIAIEEGATFVRIGSILCR
jgi:pyridoxal phosphate enzyme (YggS family)